MVSPIKGILITASFISLLGCNISQILPNEPIEQRDVTITSTAIIYKHTDADKSILTKSGITISLEPVNSVPQLFYRVETKARPTLIVINGQKMYDVIHRPFFKETQIRSKFLLKLSNKTNRVLRPKGAILTVDIDGASTSIPESYYKELSNLMLVPNSAKEIEIYGAELDLITSDSGVIRVGLYEVGVGEQFENFEWYFNFNKVAVSDVLPLKVETESLTPTAASSKNGEVYPVNN